MIYNCLITFSVMKSTSDWRTVCTGSALHCQWLVSSFLQIQCALDHRQAKFFQQVNFIKETGTILTAPMPSITFQLWLEVLLQHLRGMTVSMTMLYFLSCWSDRALATWTLVHTDFVAPPVAASILSAVDELAFVTAVPWGGFSQAERCRVTLGHEDLLKDRTEKPEVLDSVAAVKV